MTGNVSRGPGRSGRRAFGSSGRRVSTIGQGTYEMQREPDEAVDALRHGIALGIDHIDTAEIYGDGDVERLVGRAVRGVRDEVFLVSKVRPDRATRRGLIQACEESLRRLGTDRLDAYLLHWLPPHPLEDVVAAFDELVAAGKVLHWGVSNFDEVRLAELVELAGSDAIVCNQVMHHLGKRSIEHAVVPFCRRHGIAVVGYSPYGAGVFPPRIRGADEVLRDVASALGATPRQVALAFLVRMSGGFTIPKASRREHVEENAGAAGLDLPEEALAELQAAFPIGEHTGGIDIG